MLNADDNVQQDMEGEVQIVDLLRTRVQDLVLSGSSEELRQLFDRKDFDPSIVNHGWDLIPVLCEGLTDTNVSENQELVEACFDGIQLFAEKGNPKEVVLSLLEQADRYLPDFKWQGFLAPIQMTLIRLPSKRQFSLQTTLDALFSHLDQIELPEDSGVDSEERKLLAVDAQVCRLLENARLYIDFMEPFVREVSNATTPTEDLTQQRNHLLTALFKILAKKLIFLYFDPVDDEKPSVWHLCNKLMKFVERLCGDLYKSSGVIMELMEKAGNKSSEETSPSSERDREPNPLPHLSVAAFHYLLYSEGCSGSHSPSIVTHYHRLEMSLSSIALMLSSPRPVIVDKGVKLGLRLLSFDQASTTKFCREVLDLTDFTAFMDNLLQAVVMCPSKEIRQQCVQIFPLLLEKFDARGKHILFMYSFRHTGHCGVKGHLLHLLKQELVQSFDDPNSDDCYMSEVRVAQVIEQVFVLPDGAKSDLLDQSDLIISCLNFVRYLVIRDKHNQSGIWTQLPSLEAVYFEQLREGLEYSRAHYQQELKNCQAGKSVTEDLLLTGIDYKVKVGKQELPLDIPKEQALSILEGALHMFDLIQSLLGRVEELVKVARENENQDKE